MSTGLLGLEIGKRAISAQQTALTVTGHNIANANTNGYTRQVASLETVLPFCTPTLQTGSKAGQIGTGVSIGSIQRIRQEFLDNQYRNENKAAGYWQSVAESISKLEVIVNEPSNFGLRAVMDQFWAAWQDLVNNPENDSVRTVVAERGATLADTFNHIHRQLVELREDVNSIIKTKVDDINTMAEQLQDLNKQILSIKLSGQEPNDLLDRRDLLLDELSRLIDIKVYDDQNGMIAVQLGGRTLVQGVNYITLDTEQDESGMHMIIWSDTGAKAHIEGGELKGHLDIRGKSLLDADQSSDYRGLVPEFIDKLNELAEAIVRETNEVHRKGYNLILEENSGEEGSGSIFFAEESELPVGVNWAQYIKVAEAILKNPKGIAAAASPTWGAPDGEPDGEPVPINFGDSRNALKIAQLKHQLILGGTKASEHVGGGDGEGDETGDGEATAAKGTMTMDDFWRSLTSTLGVQGQQAYRMVENQENLIGELDYKRQSISGVSLDEEMTNMIRYQHAYNAAARFINAIDEQLELVVNRLGLVGR